jgi:hypothetical protein
MNVVADACSETLGRGSNDPATQVPQMLAANIGQMPLISAGGQVMMTLRQVKGVWSSVIQTTCFMQNGAGIILHKSYFRALIGLRCTVVSLTLHLGDDWLRFTA